MEKKYYNAPDMKIDKFTVASVLTDASTTEVESTTGWGGGDNQGEF